MMQAATGNLLPRPPRPLLYQPQFIYSKQISYLSGCIRLFQVTCLCPLLVLVNNLYERIPLLLRYTPVKGLVGSWLTPDLGGAPGYKLVGRAHLHKIAIINTINSTSCSCALPVNLDNFSVTLSLKNGGRRLRS